MRWDVGNRFGSGFENWASSGLGQGFTKTEMKIRNLKLNTIITNINKNKNKVNTNIITSNN